VPAAGLGHRVDVHEVDHLGNVGLVEPERVRIAVDRDNAQPELLRPSDRAPLMPARADEENGSFHAARC
jgi:hypothetical protein